MALSLGSPPPEVIRHRASMEPGLSSPLPNAIHEGGAAIRPADRGNKGFGAPRVKPTRADWLLPPIGVPRNLCPPRNGILIAALPSVPILLRPRARAARRAKKSRERPRKAKQWQHSPRPVPYLAGAAQFFLPLPSLGAPSPLHLPRMPPLQTRRCRRPRSKASSTTSARWDSPPARRSRPTARSIGPTPTGTSIASRPMPRRRRSSKILPATSRRRRTSSPPSRSQKLPARRNSPRTTSIRESTR